MLLPPEILFFLTLEATNKRVDTHRFLLDAMLNRQSGAVMQVGSTEHLKPPKLLYASETEQPPDPCELPITTEIGPTIPYGWSLGETEWHIDPETSCIPEKDPTKYPDAFLYTLTITVENENGITSELRIDTPEWSRVYTALSEGHFTSAQLRRHVVEIRTDTLSPPDNWQSGSVEWVVNGDGRVLPFRPDGMKNIFVKFSLDGVFYRMVPWSEFLNLTFDPELNGTVSVTSWLEVSEPAYKFFLPLVSN